MRINEENNFAPEKQDVLTLNKGDVTLKILPKIGGRIVFFSKGESGNILKSDSSLWHYKFTEPVEERIYNPILPFNGHIIWLGGQTDWWRRQNVKPEMKNKGATWPPDPFLIYGNYVVTQLNKSRAVLESLPSIYTGVRLIKKIEISDDGKVTLYAEAENIREEAISWDLWFNTRVDGYAKVYVPVREKKNLRMQYNSPDTFDKMPYKIIDGFFTFITQPPADGKQKRDGKALIYPETNKIFAFTQNTMFVVSFEKYDKTKVHPEHGMAEIYNSVDKTGDALTELEYHSPYKTILPGEKIISKEVWRVVEYRNKQTDEDRIRFIRTYLSLKREEI